jgi:hypothetical protein
MGEQIGRRYAPLVVAVLVLVAIGGTWLAVRGDGTGPGSDGNGDAVSRAPLRLVGWAPAGDGSPDPRYHLADGADLPHGPGLATVHAVETAPGSAGLRSALGPLAASLRIDPSGQWSAGLTPSVCASALPSGAPVASAGSDGTTSTVTRCNPVPGEGGSGGPDPLAVAQPLLDALGLGDAAVGVSGSSNGTGIVTADPVVDGLPTSGLRTAITVAGSHVTSGTGWLVRTKAATDSSYPVVTAAEAYQQLRRTPLPMPLIACPAPMPGGTDPVTCGGPVTVTGAELGLSLQQSVDGYLLVPAWFFRVDGTDNPLVQVAVDPALVEPSAPTAGSGSGGGGSSAGSGGVPVPDLTVTPLPPSPPSAGTVAPDQQSRFTSVQAAGAALDVRFWGGVASCFGYDVRVRETSSAVRLRLVEHRVDGSQVCPDLAMERQQRVALDAPLGRRTVIDAATGATLPTS